MNVMLISALLLAQPQAPAVRAELIPSPRAVKAVPLDYWAAVDTGVKRRQPVVMFLGIGSSRPVEGAVVGQQDYMTAGIASADYPGIIVGMPEDGWMVWRVKLPPAASDADIQRAIAPKAMSQAAAPFFGSLLSSASLPRPAERDAELEGRGPWPKSLDFPEGMRRYRRAKNTQSIVVLNDQDSITAVPRTQLDKHWQMSGGMEGISGFRSDVYRNDARPRTWIGNIMVKNRFGHYQPNRGHLRSYPDGAKFLDVLSKDGVVFEVRQREKIKGVWESTVAYEDPEARPAGYTGKLARTCASCHSEAGSGEYGLGLVPGSDTVLSDPFPELER